MAANKKRNDPETPVSRFESMLTRHRSPYLKIEAPASWTAQEKKQWHARLVDIAAVDDDIHCEWGWMLPRSPAEQRGFQSCANQVIAIASKYPIFQKMIGRLDGPKAHLPALFWRIVQTVQTEHERDRRDEQLVFRKKLLKDARAVKRALSQVILSYQNLVSSSEENRELCLASLGGRTQADERVFAAQIERHFNVIDRLKKCLCELEEGEEFFWYPIAKQTISNVKVDTYSAQQLFYIVKTMLGDRRWLSVYMMMDAVSAVLGFPNPFGFESLKEQWKGLRTTYPDYELRFQSAIDRRRGEYLADFYNYIGRLQEDGQLPNA